MGNTQPRQPNIRELIRDGLRHAYPTKAALAEFLFYKLNKNFDEISDGLNLKDAITDVLQDAISNDYLKDLLEQAVADKPRSRELKNALDRYISLENEPNVLESHTSLENELSALDIELGRREKPLRLPLPDPTPPPPPPPTLWETFVAWVRQRHLSLGITLIPVGVATIIIYFLLRPPPYFNPKVPTTPDLSFSTITPATSAGSSVPAVTPTGPSGDLSTLTVTSSMETATVLASVPTDIPTPAPSNPTETPTTALAFSIANGDEQDNSWGSCSRAYEIPPSLDPNQDSQAIASWFQQAKEKKQLNSINRLPLSKSITGMDSHFQDVVRMTSDQSSVGLLELLRVDPNFTAIYWEEFPSLGRENANALEVTTCSSTPIQGTKFEPVKLMPNWSPFIHPLRTPDDDFFAFEPGESSVATIDFDCTKVSDISTAYRPTLKLPYTYQGQTGMFTRKGPILVCPQTLTLYRLTGSGDNVQIPGEVYEWNGNDYVPGAGLVPPAGTEVER